jgi:ribonuclease HII
LSVEATHPQTDKQPTLNLERVLWAQGRRHIAGIDEAGRGAWAGPVVAAAVVFDPRTCTEAGLSPVRDSKLLSPRQRARCYDLLLERALDWGVGIVPASVIDATGILNATRQAMRLAVGGLGSAPDHLLIDAVRLPELGIPQHALIKGDRLCLSISAASVLAKVTRDRIMCDLDRILPGYGLAVHKGYGTARHRAALECLRPSAEHRHTFAPIAWMDKQHDGGPGGAGRDAPAGLCGCGDHGA